MTNCHFVVDEEFGDMDCMYGEFYEPDAIMLGTNFREEFSDKCHFRLWVYIDHDARD